MPGMAASPAIFEHIKLPEDRFKVHLLEWFMPYKKEPLAAYAKRMTEAIKHQSPVLLGVSFGGILIQEMAKHIEVKKLIVISSVKTRYEFPRKMIFSRYTKIHKLLPTGLANNIELLSKYAFGESVTKRLELYKKYLAVREKHYLDWSIDQIVNWKQDTVLPNLVHIHGEKDIVFPITYIKECIRIKDGTHAMILNKYRWFNKNLPEILSD